LIQEISKQKKRFPWKLQGGGGE